MVIYFLEIHVLSPARLLIGFEPIEPCRAFAFYRIFALYRLQRDAFHYFLEFFDGHFSIFGSFLPRSKARRRMPRQAVFDR